MDWEQYGDEGKHCDIDLREVTVTKVIDEVCRTYGYVRSACNKADGINSLETLLREPIFRSYRDWMLYERNFGVRASRRGSGRFSRR
jgi:hypothetical protein